MYAISYFKIDFTRKIWKTTQIKIIIPLRLLCLFEVSFTTTEKKKRQNYYIRSQSFEVVSLEKILQDIEKYVEKISYDIYEVRYRNIQKKYRTIYKVRYKNIQRKYSTIYKYRKMSYDI